VKSKHFGKRRANEAIVPCLRADKGSAISFYKVNPPEAGVAVEVHQDAGHGGILKPLSGVRECSSCGFKFEPKGLRCLSGVVGYNAMVPKAPNPFCPVVGCKTKTPHLNDPLGAGMMREFSQPERLAQWSLVAMLDLRLSIIADIEANRVFAWQTRLRQVEEIYIRALYALFVASDDELPHIFSGALPNSVTVLYRKVNALVFEGRGDWEVKKPGESVGEFTSLEMLHSSGHASFGAILTAISFIRNPETALNTQGYVKHLGTYCGRLDYMHNMFKAGKTKEDVLGGMIAMHRPASYWQA
jgi:hypothetical protein